MNKFLIILNTLTSILLLSLLAITQARSIEFRSCTSDWSPEYFSNFSFYVHNGSVSCEFDLIRPIVNDMRASIEFQIRLRNSKKYQTLFEYNFDVCRMVMAFKDTMFKRLFKSLLKYSNFIQNCPVHEGHYYLNNYHLESGLIPIYLYPGDYRFRGRGYLVRTLKNRTKLEDFVGAVTTEAVILDN